MNVLVLGGYGAVGAHVEVTGSRILRAGRDAARADRVVDLREPGSAGYRAALEGVDVVVNAAGLEDPDLVAVTAAAGVAFVDVTATSAYVAAIERLELKAPVLLNVGLAPGLTTLLAADLADRAAPIDIAILLGTGDAHGAAATAWTIGLLGTRFPDPATGVPTRNFSRPRTFDLPGFGRRRLYRADFSDQHTLTRDLGVPVRTHLGLTSRAATAALAVASRVPAAGRLLEGKVPGSDRWLVLARSGGEVRWARGRNQSRATAALAGLAASRAVGLPAGVHHLYRVAELADVPGGGIQLGR